MKTVDLSSVKSLEEFSETMRKELENFHGKGYCNVYDAVTKYVTACNSYLELGTYQGGTAAAALLTKPNVVKLVDNNFKPYEEFLEPLASSYSDENDIVLIKEECSSLDKRSILMNVDVLLIDSTHNSGHMKKELALHAHYVNHFIIAHDTSMVGGRANDTLYRTLEKFANKSDGEWRILERDTKSVGYTVLERINDIA